MAINRRILISSLTAACLGASCQPLNAAAPNAQLIEAVETYLNNIATLEANFTQIAPNGELSTGILQLSRPGRLKMDYDPPSKILLIAPGDWRLIFYDASIRQVNTIPLDQTPLGLLLDANITLDGDIEVIKAEAVANELAVSVARRGQSDQGEVTLVFERSPMTLRRWQVIDAQGLTTTIVLNDTRLGVAFEPGNFHWRDPKVFGFPQD